MRSLIIHPDVVRRRKHVDALRMELAELFDEYVRVSLEELPTLRYRYAELFGAIERRTQERMLELRQRKRMVELFAIKLDRGQTLDAKMVELVMRAVMNENGEVRSRMDRAVRYRESHEAPGPERSARAVAIGMRDIYRRLARRLHPDARGGSDAIARRYWDVVQSAYARGDLELLRALDHLVHEAGSGDAVPSDALEREVQRLQETIRAERRRLAAGRATEPYTLRDSLYDDSRIASHRAELERELAAIDEEITTCNRFLDPIFETVRTNEPPDVVQSLWHDFVERMYLSGRY